MYLFFCGEKEIFGGLQSLPVEISERRLAEGSRIFTTDPIFTHVKALLQVVQSERLRESMIQIVFQFFQIRSTFSGITFQVIPVYKKFRQQIRDQSGIRELIF